MRASGAVIALCLFTVLGGSANAQQMRAITQDGRTVILMN
jgi:hypothetical protein